MNIFTVFMIEHLALMEKMYQGKNLEKHATRRAGNI